VSRLDALKCINTLLGFLEKKLTLKRRVIFIDATRNIRLAPFMTFSFYGKSIKAAIKPDRCRLLKSVDESLKSHHKQFKKYVSEFRKANADVMRHEINELTSINGQLLRLALSKEPNRVCVSLPSPEDGYDLVSETLCFLFSHNSGRWKKFTNPVIPKIKQERHL
jgi:hypothetical protein